LQTDIIGIQMQNFNASKSKISLRRTLYKMEDCYHRRLKCLATCYQPPHEIDAVKESQQLPIDVRCTTSMDNSFCRSQNVVSQYSLLWVLLDDNKQSRQSEESLQVEEPW